MMIAPNLIFFTPITMSTSILLTPWPRTPLTTIIPLNNHSHQWLVRHVNENKIPFQLTELNSTQSSAGILSILKEFKLRISQKRLPWQGHHKNTSLWLIVPHLNLAVT